MKNFIGPMLPVGWDVELCDKHCVVFAATKARAKWIAVRDYWDAGYGRGPGDWPRPVAYRNTRYDRSRLAHEPARAWSEDSVQDTL